MSPENKVGQSIRQYLIATDAFYTAMHFRKQVSEDVLDLTFHTLNTCRLNMVLTCIREKVE
jgi:hypothetical protein